MLKSLQDLHRESVIRFWQQNRIFITKMTSLAVFSYVLADSASLGLGSLIPDAPIVPAPLPIYQRVERNFSAGYAENILNRNIFSSQNVVPADDYLNSQPRRTNLPWVLIGCMVFEDELNSIATIEDRTARRTFPVQVDDLIDGQYRVVRIDQRRVYFTNIGSGSFEYLEMAEQFAGLDLNVIPVSAVHKDSGVTQTGLNQYEVSKAALDKSLANLPDLLKQARAIPNFENGVISGFRIVEVDRGSFFEQLGIKAGDVITSFNGEPINDLGKVTQLFGNIRDIDKADLSFQRGGRTMTSHFAIK